MNKIYLKNSFAGYPVWEYTEQWYYFELKIFDKIPCDYRIHKDIVEWMKDHFEEVKERPTSWEELWEIGWYYISWNSEIIPVRTCRAERPVLDMFKTRGQAEASLALAQITQLLYKYDIPEISKDWYYINESSKHTQLSTSRKWLLRFDTVEKRDHFYKHHKALIDKLAPFYIF